MMRSRSLLFIALAGLIGTEASAQSQVTSVAANPNVPTEIWACDRGNDSVSVVDTTTGTTVAQIPTGVWPRSIAFDASGSLAFVANQRGNVEVTKHFVTPFDGTEKRGTISVIDVATRSVVDELNQVGTEPYGVVTAPNGEWIAVSGFHSGTIKFYDTAPPHALITEFQYDKDLNHIPGGKTTLDLDANKDFVADMGEPRAFAITADSLHLYVAHSLPGFVSVLDLTLDGNGQPTSVTLDEQIDLNEYPFHPIFNPTPVQTVQSQGLPRFADDIAISPDGTRALVPHLLHNVNHDVNHTFPGLAGDFANRVYPALTVVDAVNNSYAQGGDTSNRLHHELSDTLTPAEYVPYGHGREINGGILTLGATGSPILGGTADFVFTGQQPGDELWLIWSDVQLNVPTVFGTLLNLADNFGSFGTSGTASLAIPNIPAFDGFPFHFQGVVFGSGGLPLFGLTNGVEAVLGTEGFGANKLGYRAGHPSRVLYNAAGDRALLLNRGSEDVFLYSVSGSDLELMTVYPPRRNHVERTALDTSTPMGDLPVGMTLVDDASTTNDDSILYVNNEVTHSLSSLRIDWAGGVITEEAPQIELLTGPDQLTTSQRIGQELFEDASRAQTAGNFNNSCASCHFEGLADGNVWQRDVGPRSTMPVYGGSLATGLILWKGVRINMGETGPMFGGENGGTGNFSDVEQQGLTDYHNVIPVPLNPHLDPITGDYSAQAALGKDLFFGTNDTGLNPMLRHAGCTSCHPDANLAGTEARGYTNDFLNPMLTSGETLGTLDPNCFSLQINIIAENVRNVNSGVDVDDDMVPGPDPDRNADGFNDLETYTAMNVDAPSDFQRDDPNSYLCPDPMGPGGLKLLSRPAGDFSIPTKLGVFATAPYFHDHSVPSLRVLLDPARAQVDPVYGDPSYPGLNKFLNEFHDLRGDDTFVSNASKVQITLLTASAGSTVDADLEAILAYIESL